MYTGALQIIKNYNTRLCLYVSLIVIQIKIFPHLHSNIQGHLMFTITKMGWEVRKEIGPKRNVCLWIHDRLLTPCPNSRSHPDHDALALAKALMLMPMTDALALPSMPYPDAAAPWQSTPSSPTPPCLL